MAEYSYEEWQNEATRLSTCVLKLEKKIFGLEKDLVRLPLLEDRVKMDRSFIAILILEIEEKEEGKK